MGDEKKEKKAFLKRVGSKYRESVERWRSREFPQLLRPGSHEGNVYLDYAGAALASKSQLDNERLNAALILGNPHTIGDENAKNAAVEALKFWGDTKGDYALIWTCGATEALRLVGQYAARNWRLFYDLDAHTSVVGLRRLAREAHPVDDWHSVDFTKDETTICLLTLESNVDGRKRCDAMLIKKLRSYNNIIIVIDASKPGPLNLDTLSGADFIIPPSFYKLFGSPTGLGCLLVKKSTSAQFLALKREYGYFGGGSLERYSATVPNWQVLKRDLPDAFSDGTPHFRGHAALTYGFAEIRRCGGIDIIHEHANSLATELYFRLSQLRHYNQAPVIRIYSKIPYSNIIACNILRSDGSTVSPSLVTTLAKAQGIIIRSGCLCNAGRCAQLLQLSHDDIVQSWERGAACGSADDLHNDGRPLGLLRISFGKDSIYDDLHVFLRFIIDTFVSISSAKQDIITCEKASTKSQKKIPKTYRIDQLLIYPVKGCRPMSVSSWPILRSGRLWCDREWLVFDRQLGVVATGKTHPRLTLVSVRITTHNKLCFSYDNHSIVVDISQQFFHDELTKNQTTIRVCGSNRESIPMESSEELSNFFAQILLNTTDTERFALIRAAPNNETSFANSAPLLLVTRHAVAKLNSNLIKLNAQPITADHFRANLLVSESAQSAEYSEERWSALHFYNGLRFSTLGPCERCATVDLDPDTAIRRDGGIVLRTIAKAQLQADCRRSRVTFGIFLGKPTILKEDTTVLDTSHHGVYNDSPEKILGRLCRGDTFFVEIETAA